MGGSPTMEDVARRAGVSRALVSLVLRGSPRVSSISREKVLAAADALGYRPNLMARSLASRRTMTIGVLLDDLHNPFHAEVADGLLEAADTAGFRLLFTTGMRRTPVQAQAIDTLLGLHTDGLVLVSPRVTRARLDEVAARVPTVVVGQPVRSATFDTVNNDEHAGSAMVVDHLVALGHRRIWHIDGGRGASARQRRAGYAKAMSRHGLAKHQRVFAGEFTEADGFRATEQLLGLGDGAPPTAIFAANDLVAAGVIDALVDHGYDVPDDVSVVGYDNTALAGLRRISLTTVNQPRQALGQLGLTTLLERVDGHRTHAVSHVLAPTLVTRQSTAPPRQRLRTRADRRGT